MTSGIACTIDDDECKTEIGEKRVQSDIWQKLKNVSITEGWQTVADCPHDENDDDKNNEKNDDEDDEDCHLELCGCARGVIFPLWILGALRIPA